jgi:hypothetical protein
MPLDVDTPSHSLPKHQGPCGIFIVLEGTRYVEEKITALFRLVQMSTTNLARISMLLAFYSAGNTCCLVVKSMKWISRNALLRMLVVDPLFRVKNKQQSERRCLSMRPL